MHQLRQYQPQQAAGVSTLLIVPWIHRLCRRISSLVCGEATGGFCMLSSKVSAAPCTSCTEQGHEHATAALYPHFTIPRTLFDTLAGGGSGFYCIYVLP